MSEMSLSRWTKRRHEKKRKIAHSPNCRCMQDPETTASDNTPSPSQGDVSDQQDDERNVTTGKEESFCTSEDKSRDQSQASSLSQPENCPLQLTFDTGFVPTNISAIASTSDLEVEECSDKDVKAVPIQCASPSQRDTATAASSQITSTSCRIELNDILCSSEDEDDWDDVEVRLLEEDDNDDVRIRGEEEFDGRRIELENDPDNLEDPNDPDDPEDPNESVGSASDNEQSESDNEDDNFDFRDDALNTPLRCAAARTVREALLLTLATSLRHNWTYEALLDTFGSMNTLLAGQPLPKTKKKLWSIVNRSGSGLVVYAYCNRCLVLLGKRSELPAHVLCECGFAAPAQKVKWFVSLSLRKQLEHFLSFPGVAALLEYPETREKIDVNAMEDIFDGSRYQQLIRDNKIVPGERTFTYVFNTDGFRTAKQGHVSAWGLLVRLNELPPSLRQKHMFLAGIWVDTREPRMNTFLRPFVAQANRLSGTGVLWKPDGVNEVRSKVIPLCMCVDSKARCAILNMTQYNGAYGCTFCTHMGVQMNGSRYPVLPFEDLPPAELRTHDSIMEAMEGGVPFEGQKGASELMLMDEFQLCGGGNAMDDLHPLYEGVAAFHTDLLLDGVEDETLELIDTRLLIIKTHTSISRKPTSIRKRRQWKGTDWRNWLLYFSVPCLQDLIPQYHVQHLELLSHAAFLLSRDSISLEDLDNAEDLLTRYGTLFQQNHGVNNMRYNVHLMSHTVKSVRNFGPLWTCSTFNFESWNNNIRRTITSPKGVIDQIVSRHLMKLHVHVALHSDIISERVKAQMNSILSISKRRVMAQDLGNNVHVLGAPTIRRPTAEEVEMIQEVGLVIGGDLSQYDRVIFKGTEYRCPQYHPDTRSNNTLIYSHDDWFGTINSIVSFTTQGDQTVCGMFVEQHDVDTPFEHAKHFAEVARESSFLFLQIERVRSPAIQIIVRENIFLVPIANNFEID